MGGSLFRADEPDRWRRQSVRRLQQRGLVRAARDAGDASRDSHCRQRRPAMIARRAILFAVLLTAACASAWGQAGPFTITPTSIPVGGGVFPCWASDSHAATRHEPFHRRWLHVVIEQRKSCLPVLLSTLALLTITGTPTLVGAFTFTIGAVEVSTNFNASQQYTVYVSTGSPLTLTQFAPAPGRRCRQQLCEFCIPGCGRSARLYLGVAKRN